MNVLLIEDNDSIVSGLKYSLEQEKYKVFSCTNVADTIKFLEENKQVDIAIIDISLPDGNGFDLYQNYIKEKNIPSIFLTARDSEDDVVKGLELGVEDYMTKPFSTKELLARMKRNIMKHKNEAIIANINLTKKDGILVAIDAIKFTALREIELIIFIMYLLIFSKSKTTLSSGIIS